MLFFCIYLKQRVRFFYNKKAHLPVLFYIANCIKCNLLLTWFLLLYILLTTTENKPPYHTLPSVSSDNENDPSYPSLSVPLGNGRTVSNRDN